MGGFRYSALRINRNGDFCFYLTLLGGLVGLILLFLAEAGDFPAIVDGWRWVRSYKYWVCRLSRPGPLGGVRNKIERVWILDIGYSSGADIHYFAKRVATIPTATSFG